MKQERFGQIKSLFEAALERAPSEREAFLEQACGGDGSLLEEVQKLLASHQKAGNFLESRLASQTKTVTMEDPYFGLTLGGRYQIERELGRGGFGVVYLAHDTHVHGKPVVIKILRHEVDRSGWCQKKFRQECEALARINHPGVVGVTDQGETPDGWPYLVLEFVDGVTLRSVIREQGMELPRVGSLIRQIGQALDAAHDHGVYHRDLKPENVMLRDLGGGQELPVIIDFGVATVADCRMGGSPLTRVAGSYPYMAPEQLSGKPEAASDIYALGVIAFEMLTGRRPFQEDSPVQLFFKQKQGVQVKVGDLRTEVSEAVQRVISKALSFDPKDRYVRALELGEDLARALSGDLDQQSRAPGKVVSAENARPVLTRRRAVGLAALGIGLLAVVAGRYWISSSGAPPALGDRTLSYFVMVQRYRDGKPYQEPFRLAGEMLFPAYYRIRLVLRSPQPGHLYLINEAPITKDGLPSYNVLFPSPAANNGSALLSPDQEIQIPSGKEYFVFDEQQGEEKLWMVWAKQSVAELEGVRKWVNPRDKGTIGDIQQVALVREFLAKHFATKPQIQKDEASKRTMLRGSGDILVNLMKLEHH